MTSVLAGLAGLRALFGLAIAATGMIWAGRLMVGRRAAPELCLMAGWGALCLVLTVWAVSLNVSLYLPMAACFVVALIGCRTQGLVEGGIWRVALLALPLWVVMLPARPSQVDTWLNLLPNQAYLVDHALLPRDGGPPSQSFLPAAPYNTQFAAFAGSLVSGGLAPNAIALFNILLLCAAGLKLARVAAGRDGLNDPLPLPWWACAAGLLLAVPLNPAFVPRVFFAGYGEASIAVTLMFAVSLSADLIAAERRRAPVRSVAVALALTLAALVNIKQSAIGLVLPLGAGLSGLGLAYPGIGRRRWAMLVAASLAPSILLYSAWRWFVLGHFAAGELKLLPVTGWNWPVLGWILRSMLLAAARDGFYSVLLAAVLVLTVLDWRRRRSSRETVLLALGSVLIVAFNLFLLFTYVAHFPVAWAVHAHSYARYVSQLSLVAMLALVSRFRVTVTAWLARRSRLLRRRLARGTVAAIVVLPLVLWPWLRFDLAPPQPLLWAFAHRTAPTLRDGGVVALIVPGDFDDAVGSLLRGVLLFTPPRPHDLRFRTELTADAASLADAAAFGATRALVTCSGAGLGGLPPGAAGLLGLEAGFWRPLAVWPYPAPLAGVRFSAMIPHAPFCGADRAPTLSQ